MRTKLAPLNGNAHRPFTHWLLARSHVSVLALLTGSLGIAGRAEAACTPTAPVNNTTVTCTGTTTNQNGTDGYGTQNDRGNTINVASGASVTGTGNGVVSFDATVNNAGTIMSQGAIGSGVTYASGPATLNNSGVISGTRSGVSSISDLNVVNSGLITGTGAISFGVSAHRLVLTNSGVGPSYPAYPTASMPAAKPSISPIRRSSKQPERTVPVSWGRAFSAPSR